MLIVIIIILIAVGVFLIFHGRKKSEFYSSHRNYLDHRNPYELAPDDRKRMQDDKEMLGTMSEGHASEIFFGSVCIIAAIILIIWVLLR